MKSRMMKWLARGAFSVLVAVAMVMAGPQYAAAEICDAPGQIGKCPPFNPGSCWDECDVQYGQGGMCIAQCCTCFM